MKISVQVRVTHCGETNSKRWKFMNKFEFFSFDNSTDYDIVRSRAVKENSGPPRDRKKSGNRWLCEAPHPRLNDVTIHTIRHGPFTMNGGYGYTSGKSYGSLVQPHSKSTPLCLFYSPKSTTNVMPNIITKITTVSLSLKLLPSPALVSL